MGMKYFTSFTPYLELFEPRAAYISELRLQHAWKNTLWMRLRDDSKGRSIRILSPGRHNHSDGPDFIDARIMLNGKLLSGDIELHFRASDWYAHKHHLDEKYNDCILHVVFQPVLSTAEARCLSGIILPVCYVPLEEVYEMEPPGSCRIFQAETETYFRILKKQGWERVNKKIKYFYENRLRFPSDVMLYWGLFKACGYRYNEENMIRLFVKFPWSAFCDRLMDPQDIRDILNELAGFSSVKQQGCSIPWTYSRTHPAHFPEKRIEWLGKLMSHYYRMSLADILYQTCMSHPDQKTFEKVLFAIDYIPPPGMGIQIEILLNTVFPLMEAMRIERHEQEPAFSFIRGYIEKSKTPQIYGVVKRFHAEHGVDPRERRQKNWLISQGVLYIRDHYCSQGMQLSCPICLLEENKNDQE